MQGDGRAATHTDPARPRESSARPARWRCRDVAPAGAAEGELGSGARLPPLQARGRATLPLPLEERKWVLGFLEFPLLLLPVRGGEVRNFTVSHGQGRDEGETEAG